MLLVIMLTYICLVLTGIPQPTQSESWKYGKKFLVKMLSLVRRFKTTHIAPDAVVVEVKQEQTKIRYENLKQPQESVLDYKRRF